MTNVVKVDFVNRKKIIHTENIMDYIDLQIEKDDEFFNKWADIIAKGGYFKTDID